MPKKKIDHYLYTGERYIAVYEDGSSEPVDESEAVDEIITDGTQLEIEGVTISGEKSSDQPNWFQNAWAQGDSAKNEQARQSWDDYMPKNYTDYSQNNSNPYQQQSNQPRYNPKVLQSKAIEPRFDWQVPIRKYDTYDGPKYSLSEKELEKISITDIQYWGDNRDFLATAQKPPIQLSPFQYKVDFNANKEDAQWGDEKKGTAKYPQTSIGKIELGALSHIPDDELINMYLHANKQAITGRIYDASYNRKLNNEFAQKLLRRFIEKKGGTYTDLYATSIALWETEIGKNLERQISNEFTTQMHIHKGKYNNINKIDISPPNFRNSTLLLQAIAGGTQGVEIQLNMIKYNGNNYQAVLELTIWDVYGVSEDDAVKERDWKMRVSGARLGLQAMWVLQKQRGYPTLRLGFKKRILISSYY